MDTIARKSKLSEEQKLQQQHEKTLKKLRKNNRPAFLRCVALALTFVLSAGALGWRLFVLQLDQADYWESQGAAQSLKNIPIVPARGNIYDTNGRELAISSTVWDVTASPDVLNQNGLNRRKTTETDAPRVAAREFASIMELDEELLYEKLSNTESKYYKVKGQVDKAQVDEIKAVCEQYGITGIYYQETQKRYYPYGELASTVLGFTNTDSNGIEGLELQYNDILAGTPGRRVSVVNALGGEMVADGQSVEYDAVDGYSIVLTIDADMQQILESYLSAAVSRYNAKQRGMAVIMDVNTGAILAMATSPAYNPNEPYYIYDDATREMLESMPGGDLFYEAQVQARTLQWRNKAVVDTYEPGSVFKIITAAAALDSGLYAADSYFTCGGTMQLYDRPMSCAGDPPTVHGPLTLGEALIQSCNLSFIQMAHGMGAHTWYTYLNAFGLTEPTGLDMPGEPSVANIFNGGLIYPESKLGPVELASCSFGQSNRYTAIQMVTAVSAAVNGGYLMQPYIVRQVLDAEGNVVSNTQPTVKRQVISQETSAELRVILEELVGREGGPGSQAYVPGYRVGGKSGTSQKLDLLGVDEENEQYISSFLGFAPADDPQIAVLMVLDEPQDDSPRPTWFGARLVGPSVGGVVRECMPLIGVEPNYSDNDQALITKPCPDVVGMDVADAQSKLSQERLVPITYGGGSTVVGQYPPAYSDVPGSGVVILYTDASEGQRTAQVPSLEGRSASYAIDTLKTAGLNVLTTGAPPTASGVIVETQSYEPGTVLPQGTIVYLTLKDPNVVETQ